MSSGGTKRAIEESDDSDEDVPIAELLRRQAAKAAAANPAPAKKAKLPVNVSSASKEKKNSTTASSSAKQKSSSRSSSNQPVKKEIKMNTPNASSDFYESTIKGGLVQQLLCRWWYAQEWPLESDIQSPPLDKGYEPLDGFKGVFICTRVSY